MSGEQTTSETGAWQAPGHPLRVQYSLAVMEEMRRSANEGFQRIPHGGIEVGGVLFGARQGDGVLIQAWRPIECGHARGPGFLLSEQDHGALRRLLEEAGADPQLRDLEPLGWFHTHTRSGIFLSGEDLEIFNRHFPESWQIALLLRPAMDQPVRAGFFVREPDGSIQAESSHAEFTLEPARLALPFTPPAARRWTAPPSAPREPQPAARRMPPPPRPARREPLLAPVTLQKRSPLPWRLVLVVFLLLIAAGAAWLSRPYWQSKNPPALSLRVEDAEGQMHVSWNRASPAILEADGGLLEVIDGDSRAQVHLSAEELRKGSLTYLRQSEDVELRLFVTRPAKPTVREMTRFLGQPRPSPAQIALEKTLDEKKQIEEESARLRQMLERESARTAQLQEAIRILRQRLQAQERTPTSRPQ